MSMGRRCFQCYTLKFTDQFPLGSGICNRCIREGKSEKSTGPSSEGVWALCWASW